MATSTVMSSLSLKPSTFNVEKAAVKGLPSLVRSSTASFTVRASGGKKIKTDKPFGTLPFLFFYLFISFYANLSNLHALDYLLLLYKVYLY